MNTKDRPTISIPTCLTEAFRTAALTSDNGERIWLEAEKAAGQHVESVFSAGCLTEDAVNLFALSRRALIRSLFIHSHLITHPT